MRLPRLGKSFIFGMLQWTVAHAVWVEAAPLEITTTALPFGQELTAYSETLTATGGTAPYTWSVLSSCVAWGRNTNSQLNVPSGLSALVAVSGGGSHSLALKADGTVAAWGGNASGQCNVPTGLSGVAAISAGYLHSVALKGDGTVAAWGSNPYGECNVPTGLSGVTAISAGERHNLALKADGTVVAWGYNNYSQCSVPTGLSGVVAISAGSNHSLALKNDGTVVAWGYNGDGRSSVPPGLTNVTAVAGGGRHSLALKADGTVVAWGNNSYSECTVPAGLSGVVGLSAGIQHSVALKSDGTAVAWGDNSYGQRNVPASLNAGSAIEAGDYHNLVLRRNDAILPEGMTLSSAGVLSGTPAVAEIKTVTFTVKDQVGTQVFRTMELTIASNSNARPILTSSVPTTGAFSMSEGASQSFTVEAQDPEGQSLSYRWTWDGATVGGNSNAYAHTAAWGTNGNHTLRCYASDDFWQNALLAEWNVTVENVPMEITTSALPSGMEAVAYSFSLQAENGAQPYTWSVLPQCIAWGFSRDGEIDIPSGLSNVIGLAAGNAHSVALKADGTVVAWGSDSSGQCHVPNGLSGVIAITGGGYHSLALKADGTVVAWGYNEYDQCTVPTGLSSVTEVDGGDYHSLALKNDGTVIAWGRNSFGQSDVPIGLSGVIAISAGSNHSLALKNDGTVIAWGNNTYDQCTVPTGLNGVTATSGGTHHSLALKNDGTVVAWGNNGFGQCTVPAGLSGVIAIGAGFSHSVALKNDGTVVAWGYNGNGQCAVPTGLGGVIAISVGDDHNLALRRNHTTLPEGLTLSSAGVLSGTTTVTETMTVTFTAKDQLGEEVFRSLELTIVPNPNTRPVLTSSAPTAGAFSMNEGSSQTFAVEAQDPEGKALTYAWTWDGAPVGANANTYSHTAADGTDGEHVLQCYVSDDLWQNILIAQWTVAVVNRPVEITTTTLPAGMEMVPYSLALEAAHGAAPYAWTSSSLPMGLTLSGAGVLSGTPPGAETKTVTFTTTDKLGEQATRSLELIIAPNPNTRPVLTSSDPSAGTFSMNEGASQTFSVEAQDPEGKALTYAWTWDGATVGENSSAYAHTAAWGTQGVHVLRCYTSDDLWQNILIAQWDMTIVNRPVEITTASLPLGMEMVAYNFSLQAENGAPPYTWSVLPQYMTWGDDSSKQCAMPPGLSGVVAFAGGSYHSMALKADGTVVAWGSNAHGQCTMPPELGGVIAIDAGASHSLALKADGTVVAWGYNNYGQCNVPTGLGGVIAIAAGGNHTLALKNDGTVVAWGYNYDGQCNVPTGLSGVVAISAGSNHSLALKIDGTVVAWGSNLHGQCTVPPALGGAIAIDAGGSHSLALKADGTVVAWGNNYHGQATVPTGLDGVTAIAAGSYHNLALKADGTVIAWGDNSYGQRNVPTTLNAVSAVAAGAYHNIVLRRAVASLPEGLTLSGAGVLTGIPTTAETKTITFTARDQLGEEVSRTLELTVAPNPNTRPVLTSSDPSAGAFSMNEGASQSFTVEAHDPEGKPLTYAWTWDGAPVGANANTYSHTAAWGTDGEHLLRCYASDDLWQKVLIAQWYITIVNVPVEITTSSLPSGMEAIAYSISLQAVNGALPYSWSVLPQFIAWGKKNNGQINIPSGLTDVMGLTAGGEHSLALKTDGSVVAWGSNSNGQRTVPTGLSGVIAISAGYLHSLALKADGTVIAWGNNPYGECNVPPGLNDVIAISAGERHNLALKADGTVVAWGYDNYGQCAVPTGLSGVTAISAGSNHSLALKADGTVVAWGNNTHGQSTVPTGLNNVMAIAGGGRHSLALKADGTVVAWGNNSFGERNVPAGLSGVIAVAAGIQHCLAMKNDGTVVAWGDNSYGQRNVPYALNAGIVMVAGHYHNLVLRRADATLPEGLTLSSNGVLSGVPTVAGTTMVTFVTRDQLGEQVSRSLELTIAPNPNTRPVLISSVPTAGAVSMNEGSIRTFTVEAQDPEGKALTYAWTWDGATMVGNSNSHHHAAAWNNEGEHILRCYASDDIWQQVLIAQWAVTIVNVPIEITTSTLPSGMEAASYSAFLQAKNGALPYASWSVLPQSAAWGTNNRGQITTPTGLADVIGLSAGGEHSLALKDDGTVVAWGYNNYGQCNVPSGLSGVTAISAGSYHNLALKNDGNVVAWGYNVDSRSTVPPGLNNVIAIAGGGDLSMALRADGTVVVWGNNNLGQCNVPADLSGVVAISAGMQHGLALKNDGTVVAWGRNTSGQCIVPTGLSGIIAISAGGNHSLALKSDGTIITWGNNTSGECNVPTGLSGVSSIAAGGQHSMALKTDGTVIAWGSNSYGQCNVPTALNAVMAIAAGSYHSLALRRADTILPKGLTLSSDGVLSGLPLYAGTYTVTVTVRDQLGDQVTQSLELNIAPNPNTRPGLTSSSPTAGAFSMNEGASQTFTVEAHDPEGQPLTYTWTWDGVPVGESSNVYTHTAAWGTDGEYVLRCYVSDDIWQDVLIAQWAVTVVNVPIEIATAALPSGMEMVAYSTSLQAENGARPCSWSALQKCIAWGKNNNGQLNVPTGLLDVSGVAAGGEHSMVLKADGTVVAWGYNCYGQCSVPSGLSSVTAIAAGGNHSLALKGDGTVVAWGWNSSSQCSVPTGLSGVAIAAGEQHSLALKTDGTVVAWGDNFYGQCNVPTGLSGVTAIAAGNNHSVALKTDGTVVAWGWNTYGQCNVPTGLSSVTAIAAGRIHCLALKADGTVVAWGNNSSGQCNVPTGLNGVSSIAAGIQHSLALKSNGTVVAWGSNSYGLCDVPTAWNAVSAIAAGAYHNMVLRRADATLPEGLTLSSNGVLSGNPTRAGTYAVTVTAQDQVGELVSRTMELTIEPNPNTRPVFSSSSPTARAFSMNEGASQAFTVEAHDPEGKALTFAWTWDDVPVGGDSSTYNHTAAWGNDGEHVLRCYASDDLWQKVAYLQWRVNVIDVPIEITTASLPSAMEMIPYQATLEAIHGAPPYSWSARQRVTTLGGIPALAAPADLDRAIAIAAGGMHALAVKANGTVVAWGWNSNGECNVPAGLEGVIQVGAGQAHSVALKRNGTVVAWGNNGVQQCNVPSDLTHVAAISAGLNHTLALKDDGTVVGWGRNVDGPCTIPEGLSNVIAVAAGGAHSMALKADGTVVAWGWNGYGHCDVPPGLNTVIAIAAGTFHSMALKADGTVVAWGSNNNGQCETADLTDMIAITTTTSGEHCVGLKADGTVVAWGANTSGQCNVPKSLKNVTAIAAGHVYSLALYKEAPQWPAGLSLSSEGVLSGSPTQAGTYTFSVMARDQNDECAVKELSMTVAPHANLKPVITSPTPPLGAYSMDEGTSRTFALQASDPEGKALTYAWTWDGVSVGGNVNSYEHQATWGTLGEHQLRCYVSDDLWVNVLFAQWDVTVENVPMEIVTEALPSGTEMTAYSYALAASNGGLPYRWSVQAPRLAWGVNFFRQCDMPTGAINMIALAGGHTHSLGLVADGTVLAWGENNCGQRNVPANLNGVTAIAAGQFYSLALKANGTVVAWGYDNYGQSTVPAGLVGVTAISAGTNHNLALKNNGTVAAWGNNTDGQCNVAGLNNGIAVAAGGQHSLVLNADGTVVAWGYNGLGQCTVPPGLSDVIAIAAGGSHSLALKDDGTVVAWGSNGFGQCTVPTGLNGVVAIEAGGNHNLALKADGTVVAWGDNYYGQCTLPTGLTKVVALAAGYNHSMVLRDPNAEMPDGLTLSSDGLLSGIPTQAGTHTVTFLVQDPAGDVTFKELTLTIEPNPNTRPVITSSTPPAGAFEMLEGTSQPFSVEANDPEGKAITFHWTLNGLDVGDATAAYTHTTVWGDRGTSHRLRCYVSDDLWDRSVYSEWVIDVMPNDLDEDEDGLPDAWEDAYDLRTFAPTAHGADDDPDGDGASNNEERLAGTDPTDAQSVFRMEAMPPAPDGQPFSVVFKSVPGRSYRILCTDDLHSDWIDVSGVLVATGYQTVWTPEDDPVPQCLYFKVIVLVP